MLFRSICQKWLALRPEERWWLYSKTAAEAGRDDQMQRGWRKAIYCALSDGANIKLETKRKPKSKKIQAEDEPQDLFGFMEKGEF